MIRTHSLDTIDQTKVRQDPSFFEVRSDGPANVLLGWIAGIKGDAVRGDSLELYAAPADEDLEYVDESDGGKTIRRSEIGETIAYRIGVREWDGPNDMPLNATVAPHHTPGYATRLRRSPAAGYRYTWRHLIVSANEAQALFDFGEFHPYERHTTAETMQALRAETEFFSFLDQAEQLIEDAHALLTRAASPKAMRSTLMGSYRPVRGV